MTKEHQNLEMTFWDHLEALRWVFVRSIAAVAILSVIAFLNKEFIFNHIFLAPKNPEFITNQLMCKFGHLIHKESLCLNAHPFQIINFKLAGQFSTHIFISIASGIVFASPYIIYEFWKFIKPALYHKEKKHSRGAVLVCSALFITGVLFAYFMILPFTIDFLGSYQVSQQVINTISLESYINNVISVTLSVGIVNKP